MTGENLVCAPDFYLDVNSERVLFLSDRRKTLTGFSLL